MKTRKYKSGTGWCVWRWTEIPTDHIVRLHVVKTPWWAICLHWLKAPDPDPYEHDHPVSFLSIVLRGAYIELREGRAHTVSMLNLIRAKDRHRIVHVAPHTLTLCLMGPKVQEWGFYTPGGRVGWKGYYILKKASESL